MKEQEAVQTGWIYRVYRKIFGNSYIGQTTNSKARINAHLSGNGNALLAKDIEEYGVESFDSDLIYNNIPEWMLSDLEIRTIKRLNTFEDDRHYNLSAGGEGSIRNSSNFIKRCTLKEIEDIKKQYESGVFLAEIGKRYGVGPETIKKILVRLGVEILSKNSPNWRRYLESKDEIVERYRKGESLKSLMKDFNCSYHHVADLIKERGYKLRGNKTLEMIEIYDQKYEIEKKYKSGRSLESIGKDYGCSGNVIRRILKLLGCKLRTMKEQAICNAKRVHPIWDQAEEVIREYQEGKSVNFLAKKYKTNCNLVKKLLRFYGHEIRGRAEQLRLQGSSRKHPAWEHSKKILEEYKNGKSAIELAKDYDCTSATIIKIIKSLNHPLKPRRFRKIEKFADEIEKEYQDGATIKHLSKSFNFNTQAISGFLISKGYKLRKSINRRPDVWKEAEAIRRKYKEGYQYKQLAKLYNCTVYLIRRIIDSEEK